MKSTYSIFLIFCLFFSLQLKSQNQSNEGLSFFNSLNEVECSILWQDVVFGEEIGINNNLIPFDFENDGTIELISSATITYAGGRGYWYTLKYIHDELKYKKIYVSPHYNTDITKLMIIDKENVGEEKLVIVADKVIEVIDLSDFSILVRNEIDEIEDIDVFSGTGGVIDVRYGDADNDGVNEIILSDKNSLFVLNKFNLAIKYSFDFNAGNFDIGNIDSDSRLEIVFIDGSVIEINNIGNWIEEYDFRPTNENYSGIMKLSDIDEDGVSEAIVASRNFPIEVFDVEKESIKYELPNSINTAYLVVSDANFDGIEDILYSVENEFNTSTISCYDTKANALLWNFEDLEQYILGMAIADFDNDQDLEIAWSNSEVISITNVQNQNLEWQNSKKNGPYSVIEIEDIDEDGDQEIIVFSSEAIVGTNPGILTIYDAVTKEIEFESDDDFINQLWTGIYDIEIIDYGNDGDLDIVIAAGTTYKGRIFVIDGDDYAIETDYSYGNLTDEFYAIEIEDIDYDSMLEFIVVNEEALYIINSNNFEIEQNISITGSAKPTKLSMGNIDADSNDEIIFCKRYIGTLDDNNYIFKKTSSLNYTTFALMDWDGLGDMEIVAGTVNGFVEILDGETFEILHSFRLDIPKVEGIEVVDLNNDNELELMITCYGKIYYSSKEGNFIMSQSLGDKLGEFEGIAIKDFDEDGHLNILIGTLSGVMEIDPSCAEFLWSSISSEKIDAQVKVYPNPTAKYITIEVSNSAYIQNLELYAMDGRKLSLPSLGLNTHKQQKISIDNIPNGIYSLVSQINGNFFYEKIVIAR